MRRTILMMSDLQSGAEQMEIVDAASHDALQAKYDALLDHLFDVHKCNCDLPSQSDAGVKQ